MKFDYLIFTVRLKFVQFGRLGEKIGCSTCCRKLTDVEFKRINCKKQLNHSNYGNKGQ